MHSVWAYPYKISNSNFIANCSRSDAFIMKMYIIDIFKNLSKNQKFKFHKTVKSNRGCHSLLGAAASRRMARKMYAYFTLCVDKPAVGTRVESRPGENIKRFLTFKRRTELNMQQILKFTSSTSYLQL